MCLAAVGDEAMCRQCNLAVRCDFSDVVCSHLDHDCFCVIFDFENSDGHSNVIIQVAFRCISSKICRKNSMNQFFGCCFTVTARDGYERNIEFLTVVFCQLLQGYQAVIHKNCFAGNLKFFFIDYDISCSFADSL